jgi:predicted AAA+ superfamily ATPase
VNVSEINDHLLRGEIDRPGVLPHLDALARAPFRFQVDFGLAELPVEPGVILIRGPRQYGKSTWMEGAIRGTLEAHGPGSALYLNGDELASADRFGEALAATVGAFPKRARVRRLFIDEITAIADWQRALKRALDAGDLRQVLVVTTGSRATDLRRGAERLPGRKGRLDRTTYLFTPISYAEFLRVCGSRVRGREVETYLLSGGCPLAVAELVTSGCLPEFVPAMIRDWVLGECAAARRSRASLLPLLTKLLHFGGKPLGQAKLAREAGLANNTVAAGYLDLLADLLCVSVSQAWDASRQVRVARQPAKFHLVNLLCAVAFHPARLRRGSDLEALAPDALGALWEWLVAQELQRRAAIAGAEAPAEMAHWQVRDHELDFVLGPDRFLEVKRGRTSPLEFAWFRKVFPQGRLTVVGRDRFETDSVRGITMEELLLDGPEP